VRPAPASTSSLSPKTFGSIFARMNLRLLGERGQFWHKVGRLRGLVRPRRTPASTGDGGMFAYFMRHWRGDQNIAQSLLVNGVLPYFALGTVFLLVYVLTFRPTYLMWVAALFFAWLVWVLLALPARLYAH
jgi:hypothetical protein